jgi:hypothetical protein
LSGIKRPCTGLPSTKLDISNDNNAGGNNQKLKLFDRGKAIATAPIIMGTNQLPKPPISIGIAIKKSMTSAWAVTRTLSS